jgi:hypothetical protein
MHALAQLDQTGMELLALHVNLDLSGIVNLMHVVVLLDTFSSKEVVLLFLPAPMDKPLAPAPTLVFVLLEPTGMEFHVLLAIMVKFGVHQQIIAFALKDSTGMDILASPVNPDKSGVLHQTAVLAQLDKTGMDFHALLVMEEEHGVAL